MLSVRSREQQVAEKPFGEHLHGSFHIISQIQWQWSFTSIVDYADSFRNHREVAEGVVVSLPEPRLPDLQILQEQNAFELNCKHKY